MNRILAPSIIKISFIACLLFMVFVTYAQQGGLDLSFEPFNGPNGRVETALVQNDGKIIIVGGFNGYNASARQFVARLNDDASIDNTFTTAPGANNIITRAAIASDGKIVIGGQFTTYNGISRNRIARLNADGTLDVTFDPGTGANNVVRPVAIQSDGKIVIGGLFTDYNGTPVNRIARLNADGSLDAGFNVGGTGAGGLIQAIAIQADGKIIIGGGFTSYNGTAINRIARLNTDGTLDVTFNPGTGAESFVNTINLQGDGKIIIAGNFITYNGTATRLIARLNPDGSLDGSFSPGTGPDLPILSTTLQSDGKILIGGNFTTYMGASRNNIARVNADGSLDATFNPGTGANQNIFATAIQSDGKIIIGGDFTIYNGAVRNRIARLMNSIVLPLKLLSFTGTRNRGTNQLVWKTADETNIANYAIEHSNNGQEFKKIATVNAQNGTAQTYVYEDKINFSGRLFYRIKINENDGKVNYSNVITFVDKLQSDIKISPNPVKTIMNINICDNSLLNTDAVIFDAKGRMALKQKIQSTDQQIDVSYLMKGIYFVKFGNGIVQKLIKE